MSTTVKLARRSFYAIAFLALGFGASQAVAGVKSVEEGEACTPNHWPDLQSCYASCLARYGEGVQFQCSNGRLHPFPYCQCIR